MFATDGDGVSGKDRSGPLPGGTYPTIESCYEAGTEPQDRPRDKRTGLTVLTPCYQCEKVPQDALEKSWRYAIEPSARSFRAIAYHDECEAVGDWPRDENGRVDSIVKRHASIIKKVREAVARKEGVQAFSSMFKTFGVG